jgi:hypothetical protein
MIREIFSWLLAVNTPNSGLLCQECGNCRVIAPISAQPSRRGAAPLTASAALETGRLTTDVTNPYFTAFDDLGGDLAAKFILQNFNSAEIEQQCSVLT